MPKLLVSLVLCLLPALVQAESGGGGFEGLAAEMTDEERAAAGIDGLSPEQQEYLDSWLRSRFQRQSSVVTAPDVPPREATVSAAEQEQAIAVEVERRVEVELAAARQAEQVREQTADDPFEASVTGGFNGWSGKTVFKLDNGEVWRQRNDKVYRYLGDDPRVSFRRGLLGLWRMTVLSTGVSVAVAPVSRVE